MSKTGKDLYICGGFAEGSHCNHFLKLCTKTNTWSRLPGMIRPTYDCKCVVIDQEIFVIGSCHNEKFSMKTNEWVEIVALPDQSVLVGAFPFQGNVLVVTSGDDFAVQLYNLKDEKWYYLLELANALNDFFGEIYSIICFNKEILVYGKDKNESTFFNDTYKWFSLATKKLESRDTNGKNLKETFSLAEAPIRLLSNGDTLFAFMYSHGNKFNTNLHKFDNFSTSLIFSPRSKWTSILPMQTPAHIESIEIADDKIYALVRTDQFCMVRTFDIMAGMWVGEVKLPFKVTQTGFFSF